MKTSRRLTMGIGICLVMTLFLALSVGAQTKATLRNQLKSSRLFRWSLSGGVAFVGDRCFTVRR